MRRALIFTAAVFGIGLLGLVLFLALRQPTQLPPIPPPNGYDDLLQAGRELTRPPFPDSAEASKPQLAAYIGQNTAALTKARRALEKPCAVPLETSEECPGGKAQREE